MTLKYKGVPVQFRSRRSLAAVSAVLFGLGFVAFFQMLATAVALDHLSGMSWAVWALLLAVFSLELTFSGDLRVKFLPEALRKHLSWLLAPVAAYGFYQAADPGIFWPAVLGFGIAYRLFIAVLMRIVLADAKKRVKEMMRDENPVVDLEQDAKGVYRPR